VSSATGRFTEQQVGFLLQPINNNRVRNLRGMSHLEAWDVRRQLIRIFGFEGFTIETLSLDLVSEREMKQGGRSRWTIVYRAQVRLTVKATDGSALTMFEDAAAGDAINQPSVGDAHDLAMKTALSQALKRCAVNLGDQFGLSLYNDGSRDAVVMRSLAYMGAPVPESEDAPVRPEPTPQTDEEPAPAPAATRSVRSVGAEQQRQPEAATPQPAVQPDDGRQAALDEMLAAARDANFADGLPAQFKSTFGHAIEQGTTAEFREATELLRGSAAA
jgi:hypothetical protein